MQQKAWGPCPRHREDRYNSLHSNGILQQYLLPCRTALRKQPIWALQSDATLLPKCREEMKPIRGGIEIQMHVKVDTVESCYALIKAQAFSKVLVQASEPTHSAGCVPFVRPLP